MATPITMEILEKSELFGSLKFVGSNAVGPQITMVLTRVMISPSAVLEMIGDQYGNLTLDGEVLVVNGSFGQVTHPDSGIVAPDVESYYVGKGIVSWQADGDTEYRDLGDVPSFKFTPTVKRLDHYSSRLGVKSKDRSVVLEKSAVVSITMDEWNAANMALVLMAVND